MQVQLIQMVLQMQEDRLSGLSAPCMMWCLRLVCAMLTSPSWTAHVSLQQVTIMFLVQKWTCQSRRVIDYLLGIKEIGRNWKVPALNCRELLFRSAWSL